VPNRESTLWQSSDEHGDEEEQDFYATQEQIFMLRKEGRQRKARNDTPKLTLSPDESMEFSRETLDSISDLFDKGEIIEIRGVSRGQKKRVFDTAYGLAATLEAFMERPVVMVDTKGFAVTLFSPADEDKNMPGRIKLRSSYQPNQWAKRPKPVRDARGQVVKDENGVTIRQVPE